MLKRILSQLLQEDSRLHQNKMAIHLFDLLSRKDFNVNPPRPHKKEDPEDGEPEEEDQFEETDIVMYPNTEGNIPRLLEPEKPEDCRFTHLMINGIKKIPVGEYSKRLVFSKSRTYVTSAIIIGHNGVGKSSFYGALEFIGMGEMKTAELYGIDKKDYIRNCFAGDRNVQAILNTTTRRLPLNLETPTKNSLPAFFISEWDIREVERMEDIGDFIFSQLGMENIRNLIILLKSAKDKLETSNASYQEMKGRIDRLIREMTELKTLLLHNIIPNSPPEEESQKDTWEKYKESHEELVSDMMKQYGELEDLTQQIEDLFVFPIINQQRNPEEEIGKINDIIEDLSEKFNEVAAVWIREIINPIITELLSEYLDKDKETVRLDYDAESMAISIHINIQSEDDEFNNGNIVDTNPRKYFNTFRFKMFVVSLKIALACCAKAIYKKNWPIVIDDVFTSSDFNNRTRMGEYMNRICQAYKNLSQVKAMKLQLIFFTQDNVIGEAVYGGLKDQEMDASLLRLHDYRCFENVQIQEDDQKVKFVDIGFEIESCVFKNHNDSKSEDNLDTNSPNDTPLISNSPILRPGCLSLILPSCSWMLTPMDFWTSCFHYKPLFPHTPWLFSNKPSVII